MVSILKNQLLKHLSRYTKNLSADKINLNTLKGEGELSNLQLDECVITDLLELPSWLQLTSAWCNHVAIKISWTKLKSVPIMLTLDSVDLTLETCELSRVCSPTSASFSQTSGKYSFIHKIIDGITIIVNTVNIKFLSPEFTSSFQMSRIRVDSRTPKWQPGDLRFTRLKDSAKGHILVFKEMSWQTMRIEASSTKDESLTPLRLLTNEARCRITIKKRLLDCTVVACRLVIILDDLLWVLTDSQLKAALHFIDSLSELIKTATKHTQRTKAQKKIETLPEHCTHSAQASNSDALQQMTAIQKSFAAVDVRETSYHLCSQRIDLHLCDDPGNGRSAYPHLKDGGALQISLQGFQIDFYPYHLAGASRTYWPKYKEATVPPAMWLNHSLNAFRQNILKISQPKASCNHAPLERTLNQNNNLKQDCSFNLSSPKSESTQKHTLANLSNLMTTCVILRIEDFILYRVTTSGRKQMPKQFIAGDKERYLFPSDLSTVHAEFTYFYYPGEFVYPLPSSKMYVHINPIKVCFDIDSCLWLNSFTLSLYESLIDRKNEAQLNSPYSSNTMYLDVKMEAMMPRIIFETHNDLPLQRHRPKSMQIQTSRLVITNTREIGSSRADLALAITSLQDGSLVFGSEFPSKHNDLCIVTKKMLSHVTANDTPLSSSSISSQITQYEFWTEPRDIWCINLDPIWIEFLGVHTVGLERPIIFIDAVPLTIWIHGKSEEKIFDPPTVSTFDELLLLPNGTDILQKENNESIEENYKQNDECINKLTNTTETPCNKTADVHVIAKLCNLVSIQIDHHQLLFLFRLAEELTELSAFLEIDTKRALKNNCQDNSVIIGFVIPQVEISLILPAINSGKEQNSANPDTILPDSRSTSDNLYHTQPKCPPLMELTTKSNADIQLISTTLADSTNIHEQISQTECRSIETFERSKEDKRISQNVTKEINSGLTSMRRGISSIITSIDTAFKASTEDDSLSIHSDYSSDSENILLVIGDEKIEDCIDIMFKLSPSANDTLKAVPIEEASEVFENENSASTLSGPSNDSIGRRGDLVSIVTFRLATVEVCRQNIKQISTSKIQIATIACKEIDAIPWDEFQIKFGTRCHSWPNAPHNIECPPSIALRMEEVINIPTDVTHKEIDKEIITSWSNKNVEIKVKDIDLELPISIVTGITEFFEDEVLPTPFLAEIGLENIRLHLIEDHPSVNITRPVQVPVDLNIKQLHIRRDVAGVLHIQSNILNSDELNKIEHKHQPAGDKDLHIILKQVMNENKNLKLQISNMNIENETIQLKQEIELLKSLLSTAQNELKTLIGESRPSMHESQINEGDNDKMYDKR